MGPSSVKRRRRALGLTQKALAKRLGVHINTIASWETIHARAHLLPHEPDCPPWLDWELTRLEGGVQKYAKRPTMHNK